MHKNWHDILIASMIQRRGILIGMVLLLLLSGAMFLLSLVMLAPTNSQITETKRFVIKRNEPIAAIAERLHQEQLIKHPLIFRLVVWRGQLDRKIQAGSFELSPSMSAYQIAERMTQGVDDLWLTFPEGLRVEEMARILAQQPELSEYNQEEFLEQAKSLEGYLFPDTYLVPRSITVEALLSLLNNTFETKTTPIVDESIPPAATSLADVIVMASIIQREAGKDTSEMAHISGILWNRIKVGEPLGVDCTLQYIEGYNQATKSWWSPPSVATKNSSSPYNTYRFAGLPPAPIANPGIAAIKASAQPIETDDFFYIHDNSGQIHYAKTLAEHNTNIQKYLR